MGKFANSVRRRTNAAARTVDKVVVDAVVQLCTRIIITTPIGKPELWKYPPPPDYKPGTLINSWYSTLDVPVRKGHPVRLPVPSAADSLLNLNEVAAQAPGHVFQFRNPAPYAFRIEYDGWSTQAPQGMVRLAHQQFDEIVSRSVRRYR